MTSDAPIPSAAFDELPDGADLLRPADEVDLRAARAPVILVVDDDPVLGRVVEACLDFEGAEVRVAHTLAEARQVLTDDLDHIVLDRMLPDGDGLDLLDDLAEHCPGVPIVVLTAYEDLERPDHLPTVDKADIASLCDVLGLEALEEPAPIPIVAPMVEQQA